MNISVVAANFNNGKFLEEFFQSVIHSTVYPRELIFVEDGSTDGSVEIIRKYLHYRFIRLIDLKKNHGFANALNIGIAAVTSKYIARVDPDDVLMPDRLKMQFDYMESHPEVDVLGGNVVYFRYETKKNVFRSNFLPEHEQIFRAYRSGDHGIQHPTVLVRSDVFKKYAYNQATYPAEDYDVFARMIFDGKRFANLGLPVNRMRVHAGSISSNLQYNTIKMTFDLRDRIFGMKSGWLIRRFYYWHILLYRKFLNSENTSARIFYISLASLCYPVKVIKRIFPDLSA